MKMDRLGINRVVFPLEQCLFSALYTGYIEYQIQTRIKAIRTLKTKTRTLSPAEVLREPKGLGNVKALEPFGHFGWAQCPVCVQCMFCT